MNLSTLYRPFELASPWPAAGRRAKAPPSPATPPGLTDLQRRLVVLHVAQATPSRAADERPAWPGIASICAVIFAALAVAAGAWR